MILNTEAAEKVYKHVNNMFVIQSTVTKYNGEFFRVSRAGRRL